MIEVKSTSPTNRSDSILVSFHSMWMDIFRNHNIKVIFRKKVPRVYIPSFMFIYINSPYSIVLGRTRIKQIKFLDIREAVKVAKDSNLTNEEIRSYFGNQISVGAYFIESTELAPRPLELKEMRDHMRFFPPQSFVILSRESKAVINKLCGFPKK